MDLKKNDFLKYLCLALVVSFIRIEFSYIIFIILRLLTIVVDISYRRKSTGSLYSSGQILPGVLLELSLFLSSRVSHNITSYRETTPLVKIQSAMNLDLLRDTQRWVLGFN